MADETQDSPIMTHFRPSLLSLVRDTVTDPRGSAGRVLSLAPPRAVLWEALGLVVILSVLLTELGELISPAPVDPMMPAFMHYPLAAAAVQGLLLIVTVHAIAVIGRVFGGTGDLDGALALTVWLQFVMVCLQVVQLVLLVVLPPAAGLLGIFGIGLFFWLLSHFIAVLHGFPSVMKTFGMILFSMIGIVFGMSLILSILGITLTGAMPDV